MCGLTCVVPPLHSLYGKSQHKSHNYRLIDHEIEPDILARSVDSGAGLARISGLYRPLPLGLWPILGRRSPSEKIGALFYCLPWTKITCNHEPQHMIWLPDELLLCTVPYISHKEQFSVFGKFCQLNSKWSTCIKVHIQKFKVHITHWMQF